MDPSYQHELRQITTHKHKHQGNNALKPINSKEKGAPINIRPFYVCPRELLLHNIFLASQIQLVDAGQLTTNVLAHAGIMLMSSQVKVGNLNGVLAWTGFNLGVWALWAFGPHTVRKALTAPELRDAMLF
jgi:hypothetical protein